MSKFAPVTYLCLLATLLMAHAQAPISQEPPVQLCPAVQTEPLTDGMRAHCKDESVEITALRSDVLHVRWWKGNTAPELASWAVLPGPLHSHIDVTPESAGFHTASLHVTVGPALAITVKDNAGNVLQQDAAPIQEGPTGFRTFKQRTNDDHFFGLGDKPGPLDRSGESFTMWNTDRFGWQESSDPIYKDIPFFLAMRRGRTLGVLFNNTFRSAFDFGHEDPRFYSFGASGGALDYFLLYGPSPREVLTGYAWLTGPTPLPPLWSLGFQQSRFTYSPESRLVEVEHRLRADRIPCDALWLDIDFQDHNMPFTVDPERFPNFPQLVKSLTVDHFHLVVITDLHIAQKPGQGYAPYDSGVAGDHFVKLPDGSPYIGTVWPGPAVFPDFSQLRTQQWWGSLYADFIHDGVAGFWNDMNEPAVFNTPTKTMPDDVQHRIDMPGFAPRTASHLEMHNVYGMLNTEGTYAGELALRPDERPYVMTRATFAGGQRYAVTWTGDNSATWNHLRMTDPQLMNLGLSGFSLAGADVGGFAGSPSPDLLTKWLEVAAFQPIDRDHSAKGTRDHEVWVDGPEQEAIRRRYIEERYRLLPYIYTTAEHTSHDGVPLMRPLFVDFPDATPDRHPIDLDAGGSEFMLGPDLLIAPNPSPEEIAPYEIHLPPGTWYDFWTGERLERRTATEARDLELRAGATEEKPVTVQPTLATLPAYVRGGSILPMQPLVQSTQEMPQGPLTLRVYPPTDPSAPCQGEVYTDDGHTFAYQKGAYARISMHCSTTPDGALHLTLDPQQGSFRPWWTQYRVEVFGWQPQQHTATTKNGEPLQLVKEQDAWVTNVQANLKGNTLILR